MTVKKLMMIGIDSATWTLLDPWIEAGRLPNLGKLRASGAYGPLASTIQPISSAAWVTFLTGMNQGQHGIFDFVRRKAGAYDLELTDASMIQTPTLFEHLGRAGLRVASLNVPLTYPVWPVNGVMVSGPFAPSVSPVIMHPRELWEAFHRAVPGYDIFPDYDPQAKDPPAKLARDLETCVQNRTRAAEFLLQREDWDVFMAVYTSPDQIQHSFWHCLPPELCGSHVERPEAPAHLRDAIFNVYRAVDEGIGRLLTYAPEGLPIFVISDHGAGALDWWVHLNTWLAQNGFLAYLQQSQPSVKGVFGQMAQRLAHLYSRAVPQPVRRRLRALLGGQFVKIKETLETTTLAATVDWSRTRVFALGSGDLYLNVKGREPQGIVEPGAEYQAVREAVITGFMQLKSRAGTPLVERVYRREELYSGQCAERGPDLTVVFADHRYHPLARYASSSTIFEDPSVWRFGSRPITGGHRPEGIIIVSGQGVQPGPGLKDARLVDLAPTILARLGLPIPPQMDGRVLSEAFSETLAVIQAETEAEPLPDRQAVYTDDEKAEIERHLGDLGYL